LYEPNDAFTVNDDLVIDKRHHNYVIERNNYTKNLLKNKKLSSYRGNRLVRNAKTMYDSTIDKYVNIYKKQKETKNTSPEQAKTVDDMIRYGFTETEYHTSGAIINYVATPSNFTNTVGW
jgi:hypothetical protein